jgi:hypothetical protein
VDPQGAVYAGGYQTEGTCTYGNGVDATGPSSNNPVVVKYAADGTALWARTATGGDGGANIYGLGVAPSGEVYAAGSQGGSLTYAPDVSATTGGALLLRLAPDGTPRWARTPLHPRTSGFTAIATAPGGTLVVAGNLSDATTVAFDTGVEADGLVYGSNALLVRYYP